MNLISLSNSELTRFFFALSLLLLFAHSVGYLFHRFKLPKVIGEISGGILLGPTFLGFFFPEAHKWLFASFAAEGKLISVIHWIGLILLMFISGFEIQKSLTSNDKKFIGILVAGTTIIPFFAGWLAPLYFDFSPYIGLKKNALALQLIIAIATAVTSIPVISRIFIDLNIVQTRFAKIVLATATIHDIILWVALAIATGLVSAEFMTPVDMVSTVLATIAFFVTALIALPKLVPYLNSSRWNLMIKSSGTAYILFICFSFSAIASILNVNIVFGALLAGIVIGILPEKFEKEKTTIKETGLAFFIPLYFAIVGLKLDLIHHLAPIFFLGFFLFTTLVQMAATFLSARIVRADFFSSINLGVAMSTRGGPGIVLATVSYDLGIINESFFVTLILTAILTSLIAGVWFRSVLAKGQPLLND